VSNDVLETISPPPVSLSGLRQVMKLGAMTEGILPLTSHMSTCLTFCFQTLSNGFLWTERI